VRLVGVPALGGDARGRIASGETVGGFVEADQPAGVLWCDPERSEPRPQPLAAPTDHGRHVLDAKAGMAATQQRPRHRELGVDPRA
jgi:hypothetical protein